MGVAWGAWAMRHPEKHSAHMTSLLELWAQKKLRPHVSKSYPFAEASAALHAMERREVHGKIVLVP